MDKPLFDLSVGSDERSVSALNLSVASLHLAAEILACKNNTPKWTHADVEEIAESGLGMDIETSSNGLVMSLHPLKQYSDLARDMALALKSKLATVHGWPVIELWSHPVAPSAFLSVGYGGGVLALKIYEQMKDHRLAA